MKNIVFGKELNNDEMGAVISALISRRNQLNEYLHGYIAGDYLYLSYKKELEAINSVLCKICIEG